jgi:dephospho-CoA kinase
MESGTPVHQAIVAAFGPGCLDEAGDIDRRALGRQVFEDERKRKRLEGLVHPAVMDRLRAWVREQVGAGRAAVGIVPLLFEIGDAASWDTVVCVAAPEAEVMARLRARGLDEREARQRLESQLRIDEKRKRSEWVIENDGTREQLRERTQAVWRAILTEWKEHVRDYE